MGKPGHMYRSAEALRQAQQELEYLDEHFELDLEGDVTDLCDDLEMWEDRLAEAAKEVDDA